jgi:hypothetical protein
VEWFGGWSCNRQKTNITNASKYAYLPSKIRKKDLRKGGCAAIYMCFVIVIALRPCVAAA